MFIEEKINAFVVRWLVSYYWMLLEEVQGSNLVGCMNFLIFRHN
jgi:hypothetical protein